MSFLPPVTRDTMTPDDAMVAADQMVTPFGAYAGASFKEGFISSWLGEAMHQAPDVLGEDEALKAAKARAEGIPSTNLTQALDEESFKASRNYRPGMPWPGMTEARAAALASDVDAAAWRQNLYQKYQGGLAGKAAGLGAQFIGGALSPENYIPFFGQEARLAMIARLGTVGGHAALAAGEGLLGTALVEPSIYAFNRDRGQDYGLHEIGADLLFGTAIGGAFGALHGGFSALRGDRLPIVPPAPAAVPGEAVAGVEARAAGPAVFQAPAEPAPAGERVAGEAVPDLTRSPRPAGDVLTPPVLARETDALNAAADALSRGEPVDVGAMVPDRAAVPPPAPATMPDRVFTPTGRQVGVRYEVVDAASLTASHTADLNVNPAFPTDLQPRDRSRAASGQQIASMAANLQPEQLGRSATAADGAPIVGPDGVVESGNARVLALRKAFADHPDKAAAYREFVESQDFNTAGVEQPVLIRRRVSDLTPEDRASFTREANARTTAAMSPSEQALSDAAGLDSRSLETLTSGDLHAAGNRPFVRSFLGKVAGSSEMGALITKDGELSKAGADRIQNALLARAYGDADLVARLAEEPEGGLGSLGQALRDVAPSWAKMRALAERGQIAREGDGTAGLMEAVHFVVSSREAGNPLHFALSQQEMFGAGMSGEGRAFLTAIVVRDARGNSRLVGRAKLADILGEYAAAAEKQQPGSNMFGEAPNGPAQILANIGAIDPQEAAGMLSRAVERPIPPPPSVVEAAPRVGKAGDELKTFAEDAGLEGFKAPTLEEQAKAEEAKAKAAETGKPAPEKVPTPLDGEIQALRDAGRLTPEDEALLRESEQVAKDAESYAAVFQEMPNCVNRFGL